MKILLIIFLSLFTLTLEAQEISTDNLQRHVYALAADDMAGRKAGTIGSEKAAQYIVNQLTEIGVQAQVDTATVRGTRIANIRYSIKGNDPKLQDEWILIVAHYDHIGVNDQGQVYNGANDNATSTAALLEMVRTIKPTKRSVMFVWFDAEEIGVVGSRYFVANPPINLENIKLVMASEMLGHLHLTEKVECDGVISTTEGEHIVKSVKPLTDLAIDFVDFPLNYLGGTDTYPFLIKGIPVMVWHTPSSVNYHTIEDDANTINYPGVQKIATHIKRTLEAFANTKSITPSEHSTNMLKQNTKK